MAATMVRLRASPTSVMREMPRRLPMMDELRARFACFLRGKRLVVRSGMTVGRRGVGEGGRERREVEKEKRIYVVVWGNRPIDGGS